MSDPVISSRTPEGEPNRCAVCGCPLRVEPSLQRDATCPNCGLLLWFDRSEPAMSVRRFVVPMEVRRVGLARAVLIVAKRMLGLTIR